MASEAATEILEQYAGDQSALLKALQDIQEEYNYLPREALEATAEQLAVPISQVVRAATFYKQFSLERRGKYVIKVCMGTACYARGAPRVLQRLEQDLGIDAGATTPDGLFTVETVNCLGACALGPLLMVGPQYHGRIRPNRVPRLIRQYRDKE
ncbi:MAG: NAD(P)H-dependent oxidoreductase subunit E [Armatimonadota bacterium]|jgi:NADH-quinone oxidoreductase subunit E